MGRAFGILIVTMLLGFCSCSTSLTSHSISGVNPKYRRTIVEEEGHDLPTPRFFAVDADLKQARIVTIRLHQHPAWKARPRPAQPNDAIPKTTASESPKAEPDRTLQAINAAFDRARMVSKVPGRTPLQQTDQQASQAYLARSESVQ